MRIFGQPIQRLLATAAFAMLSSTAVAADDAAGYPTRPVTIVVGYPPGGATDIIARLVATKLSESLGQPVIVENKPGAGSNIATEQVVRAQPDGHTLLVETIANATNMTVYKNVKYDSARDLAPIVQFMSSPSVLVVSPALKPTDLKSLIALAKAEPGQLTYASSGVGGSPQMAFIVQKAEDGRLWSVGRGARVSDGRACFGDWAWQSHRELLMTAGGELVDDTVCVRVS